MDVDCLAIFENGSFGYLRGPRREGLNPLYSALRSVMQEGRWDCESEITAKALHCGLERIHCIKSMRQVRGVVEV